MEHTIAERPYMPRIVDTEIQRRLRRAGAVSVRGPRWCGKTEAAYHQCASAVFMQDPDERAQNLDIAKTKPSLLLQGEKPLLIDEWQEAPQIWDAVRFAIDKSATHGQFLLTGSVVPKEKPAHSGTGRFSFVDMLPMSLFESGDSTGEVSLRSLFDKAEPKGHSLSDVETAAFLVCRGGWPVSVLSSSDDDALGVAFDYVDALVEEDISQVDGVSRDPQAARLILSEYARCVSSQATLETIRKDIKIRGTEPSRELVGSYLAALRNLFVVQDLDAWSPSLHARSRITTTPKRHFACPSIGAAALNASPEMLLHDLSTLGLLFEDLCVRDLRVYARSIEGDVFHYHDNTGLEVDAVIFLRDGRYALLEVKIGAGFVDEAAANLLKMKRKIDTSVMGEPAFCAVLLPGGYAYRRSDGVNVIPITCLRD